MEPTESVLWVSDNGRWTITRVDDQLLMVAQTIPGHSLTVWHPRFRSPIGKGKKRKSFKIDWGRDDVLPPVPYVEKATREKLVWLESQQGV